MPGRVRECVSRGVVEGVRRLTGRLTTASNRLACRVIPEARNGFQTLVFQNKKRRFKFGRDSQEFPRNFGVGCAIRQLPTSQRFRTNLLDFLGVHASRVLRTVFHLRSLYASLTSRGGALDATWRPRFSGESRVFR